MCQFTTRSSHGLSFRYKVPSPKGRHSGGPFLRLLNSPSAEPGLQLNGIWLIRTWLQWYSSLLVPYAGLYMDRRNGLLQAALLPREVDRIGLCRTRL